MLYKLQSNIFIYGLFAIVIIGCLLYERSCDLMAAGTLLAFVSQMSLLLFFAKSDNIVYSEKALFTVVLIYSLLLGTVFMALSYIYDGDTFMFTKNDAMIYYKESMRASDIGFWANAELLVKKYEFDDWGSLFYDSFLMSIIPDKFFLNFTYMITGAISSVLLFRICCYYMPKSYSFIAALSYATSSYLVMFHCTFLKESLFVAIVISTIYNVCRLIHKDSNTAFLGSILSLAILFFFRPAVAAFVIISFSVYFAIKQHGSALSLFMYMAGAVMFLIVLKSMMDIADAYTAGSAEKLVESGNGKAYSGGFNTFVSIFGGFFGPFPTLFTKPNSIVPSTIQFYGSGLMYRLFMILPFLTGLYLIIKNKELELLPIALFILVEMLATGMVNASLELRKVFPHIPLTYIISFYGLSKWQETGISRRIPEFSIYALALGLLFLWNVVKTT